MTDFWDNVDIKGPEECWPWTGRVKGWPGYRYGSYHGRPAHRKALELSGTPVPLELHVCHKCDNPPCCNPAHLFVGTHSDNMQDMAAKGRHGSQQFPERIKREWAMIYATGEYAQSTIANLYGGSQSYVGACIRARS